MKILAAFLATGVALNWVDKFKMDAWLEDHHIDEDFEQMNIELNTADYSQYFEHEVTNDMSGHI